MNDQGHLTTQLFTWEGDIVYVRESFGRDIGFERIDEIFAHVAEHIDRKIMLHDPDDPALKARLFLFLPRSPSEAYLDERYRRNAFQMNYESDAEFEARAHCFEEGMNLRDFDNRPALSVLPGGNIEFFSYLVIDKNLEKTVPSSLLHQFVARSLFMGSRVAKGHGDRSVFASSFLPDRPKIAEFKPFDWVILENLYRPDLSEVLATEDMSRTPIEYLIDFIVGELDHIGCIRGD